MLLVLLACTEAPELQDSADLALCETACEQLYGDEGCGIQRAGSSQQELLDRCLEACTEAMAIPGELGDYEPYERAPATEAPTLDNRAQAERWAQCISELACEQIEDGYCAPVW